ncbi:MAG: hypothetical protein KC621_00800, partial [Myxococcales bacterium]|nr:hypothetical protein [Myxococcales bacterium]
MLPTWPPARALHRLGAIGDGPEDDDEERLQHRFLVWMGTFMSLGGVAWAALTVLAGVAWTAIVPLGYVAVTVVNFAVFARTRRFDRARWVQVTASLLLPFLFQTVLGGFAGSGSVMLWALLALIGSLTFSSMRESGRWMVMFLVLTVCAGLADPWVRTTFDHGATEDLRTWMSVLSIGAISTIVFGLTTYVLWTRRSDNLALSAANERVSALVEVLEAQVRRAEQAEHESRQANVAKSNFLANMSHELRTPLNAILGYAELLLEDEPHVELQRIRGAGTHLLELIDDVLDLAKIEAGRMEVVEDVVDLPSVVRGVVATLDPLARKNGNRLSVRIEKQICPVMSDEPKLKKILYNLVGNAAKFTHDGEI